MVSAIYQHDSAIGIHISIPFLLSLPPHPTPLGGHEAPDLGSLYHTANSHWLSILHIVICLFQCTLSNHSTLSFTHPCPKAYPLCLHRLCCPANTIISTIFLDFIYMVLIYNIYPSLSNLLHSV